MKDNTIPSILNNLTYQQQVYVCYRYLTEIDPVIQDIASKIDDIETYIQEEVAKAIETELTDETITQIISEQVTKYMTENPIKYEDITFSTEQDKTALTNNINKLLNAINGTTLKDNSIPLSKIIQIASVNPTVILTKENDGSLSYTSIDNNEILGKKDNKVQGLSLNGDILPTYQNGKVLSNNGTSLQWVDQTGGGGGGSGGGIPDDNSVSTQKIQDGAVTEQKLANDSVTSNKILDGAVISTKLGDLSVTTQKIQDDAITENKLSQDVSDKLFILPTTDDNGKYLKATGEGTYDWDTPSFTLGDNTVSTQKIQDSAVTTSKLDDEAVTRTKIASGAVSNTHLGDLSVSTNKIQNKAVTNEKILDDSITKEKLRATLQRQLLPNYTNAQANKFLMVQQGGADATLTWAEAGGGGGPNIPNPSNYDYLYVLTVNSSGGDTAELSWDHPSHDFSYTYTGESIEEGKLDLGYGDPYFPYGTESINETPIIDSTLYKYDDDTACKVAIQDSIEFYFKNYDGISVSVFKPLFILCREGLEGENTTREYIDLSGQIITIKENDQQKVVNCARCISWVEEQETNNISHVKCSYIIPKELKDEFSSNCNMIIGFRCCL